jgi:hypothetical protein
MASGSSSAIRGIRIRQLNRPQPSKRAHWLPSENGPRWSRRFRFGWPIETSLSIQADRRVHRASNSLSQHEMWADVRKGSKMRHAGRQPAWQHHPQNRTPRLVGVNRPAELLALCGRSTPESSRRGRRPGLLRWAMYGRRPRCKRNLTYERSVRVQPCIRPLNAAVWLLALM